LSYEVDRLIGPGLAAWDDYGKMPEAARRSLQEAAKIVVPDASFVLRVLGFYLLVLAANAVFFWLIGRIELAWATSPVIAIAATLTVVYVAQLDIGFVRARTEIGVVELDAGYPRAHFTRYMALYGSLGTSYDVEFADPTAVALPFYSGRELLQGQSRSTVRLVRQSVVKDDEVHATAVKLEGFQVASNATGLLHAEQMLDLGGSIKVDKSGKTWRLVNGTNLSLAGGGLVQKGVWTAWLGPLAPGDSQELAAMNDANAESEIHSALAALSTKAGVGLNLKELVDQVAHGDDKLRLVAWTEGEVGGMTISPSAAQMRAANLVVVHLEPGALEPIEIDANSRAAVDPKLPAMFPNTKAESNDD
jgi:hypothetical protein